VRTIAETGEHLYKFGQELRPTFGVIESGDLYKINQHRPLPTPLLQEHYYREGSSFFQSYYIYLYNFGVQKVSLVRTIYEALGWPLESVLHMHQITTEALQQRLAKLLQRPVPFFRDEFDSLHDMMIQLITEDE
jgi:hypothetical protein